VIRANNETSVISYQTSGAIAVGSLVRVGAGEKGERSGSGRGICVHAKAFGFRVRALYKHRATVSAAAPFRSSAKPNDWARVRARVARIGCWIIYEWSV